MQQAKLSGDFLPWRDVLHDGPVPANLALEDLSKIRADFIIEQGWGEADNVRNSFRERDKQLQSYQDYDEIILWFEHDLYDQLQILQILDYFSDKPLNNKLHIICTDNYLGHCSPKKILALQQYKKSINDTHLRLAKHAWHAFRSSTPQEWSDLLDIDTSPLPFLHKTIRRLLAEYPSCRNGLSLTAQLTLEIISKKQLTPWELFECYQNSEESHFLGDSSFWKLLNALLTANPPLITTATGDIFSFTPRAEQETNITEYGKQVLPGKENYLSSIKTNHWIGGVHLKEGNIWCWNSSSKYLQKTS